MNIKEAIKTLAADSGEIYCKICTVDAVDEKARTVDVSPIDESAPILGVNLQANQEGEAGLVAFPKTDSHVVVAFLTPATAVVVLTEEIEKVVAVIGNDKPLTITAENSGVTLQLGDTTINLEDNKVIQFNKGDETTANATELKTQLEIMSGRIDAIIQAIQTAPVAPMDGGASLKASLVAALAPKLADKEMFSKIIDDNIKH